MSRPLDAERGARIAYDTAKAVLSPLPLFPSLACTPELAAEWEGILNAARAEIELNEAMAVLRYGR
jgi:hypothetical protein